MRQKHNETEDSFLHLHLSYKLMQKLFVKVNFFLVERATSHLKSFTGILYACFCTRLAMEFPSEFGCKQSTLIGRWFHGGGSIEAYIVSLDLATFKRSKPTNEDFHKLKFVLSFCSVIPSRNHFVRRLLLFLNPNAIRSSIVVLLHTQIKVSCKS